MEAETTIAIYKFVTWLRANQKRVIAGAIVAAIIAAIVGFCVAHKRERETDANQMLLALPLGLNPSNAPNPGDLLNISREYPGTAAGADAQLLAARELFLESKFKDAEQAFSKFISDNPGHPLIPQAQVGVAASLESEGKIPEAMTKYKEIAAVYSSQPNISLPVKLTLGRLNEDQREFKAAVAFYEGLLDRNDPRDPWVAEARERLVLLLAKHPELSQSGENPYQVTPPTPPPSPLNPTPEQIELSPASSTQNTPPAPTTNQGSPAPPPMGGPPPVSNPGGNPP
ncbi:MAG: tetratricopeptide repeat protein [Verrucomicrobiota bacterium]|jgi:tetratricopeptide (TPR) repeat protein